MKKYICAKLVIVFVIQACVVPFVNAGKGYKLKRHQDKNYKNGSYNSCYRGKSKKEKRRKNKERIQVEKVRVRRGAGRARGSFKSRLPKRMLKGACLLALIGASNEYLCDICRVNTNTGLLECCNLKYMIVPPFVTYYKCVPDPLCRQITPHKRALSSFDENNFSMFDIQKAISVCLQNSSKSGDRGLYCFTEQSPKMVEVAPMLTFGLTVTAFFAILVNILLGAHLYKNHKLKKMNSRVDVPAVENMKHVIDDSEISSSDAQSGNSTEIEDTAITETETDSETETFTEDDSITESE